MIPEDVKNNQENENINISWTIHTCCYYWALTVLFWVSSISEVGVTLDCESWQGVESMLLVRWRAGGARWRRQRKEPAWVVGEHKQLDLVMLPCLASPPPLLLLIIPEVGDTTSASWDGISTFMSFLIIASFSIVFFLLSWNYQTYMHLMIHDKKIK